MAAAYLPQAAPTTRPPKGWLATLIVAALMLGIFLAAIIGEGAVAGVAPKPVSIASGVVVQPAKGWDFAGRSDDGATVLLTDGNGSMVVAVIPAAEVTAVAESERVDLLSGGTVTATDIKPVTIGGRAGQRFDFSGTVADLPKPVEGTVTAVAGNDFVMLFEGWAGPGDYPTVRGDIDAMIASAVVP